MRTYRFTILSLLLLIIFPQVIFQIMASPITAGLSDLAFYLVDYSLFTLGGILGVLLLWKNGFRDIFKMRFRWSYLGWFILLFGLNVIWVLLLLPIIYDNSDRIPMLTTTAIFVPSSVFASFRMCHELVLAPFVEEILNRGVILSLLTKWQKYYIDILVSGAIFSINHFLFYGWQNLEFIKYFIPGILMALLFRKTKCIYYPMVYHILWNAVPYLMGWR